MMDLIGNVKKGGVAEQGQIKTGKTLRRFCRENKLSYDSILNGYFSKKAKNTFKKLGVKVA